MSNNIADLYKRQNNNEFKLQKSDEWYIQRSKLLTASQISSILNNNIYESSYDLFINKIYESIMNDIDKNYFKKKSSNNINTAWGNKFEHIAVKFYEYLKKEKVIEIGLVPHKKYKWLGASPDGLLLSGNLLEIKCPIKRKITKEIPLSYWIQMQIQMEVCNIDNCDYLECCFYEYNTKDEYDKDEYDKDLKGVYIKNNTNEIIYWKLENTFLQNVKRDKKWFRSNKNTLNLFNSSIIKIKKLVNKNISKFNNFNYNNLRNIIEKIINEYKKKDSEYWMVDWGKFIAVNKIKNYILDDPIVDYLECISKDSANELINNGIIIPNQSSINTFTKYLFNKGNEFENKIINTLNEKFGDRMVTISTNPCEIRSYKKYKETVNHIKKGTPIIYHGILHDYERGIYGIPDLIVRKDYINLLLSTNLIQINENNISYENNISKNYVIVEIKFSKLRLCADGIHITNSTKLMSYNKSQLYIYNKILGAIQNFESSKSYIIGKCWEYKKDNKIHEGESLEKMGCVNFKKNDKYIETKTEMAINWLNDLKNPQLLNNMSIFPPSQNELKPNMCYINDKWQNTKDIIATRNNDITQLWMCNHKNRSIAEKNNIVNWRTHTNLKAIDLGISGKRENVLQNIIDMNQDICKYNSKIYPLKLNKKQKISLELNNKLEIFIDFETINKLLLDNNFNSDFIFMIGIGYIIDGKWNFKYLVSKDLSKSSEKKILVDFADFINNIIYKNASKKRKRSAHNTKNNKVDYRLWHWGNAEKYLYENATKRHNLNNTKINLDKCCDLLNIFKDINIVANGMLNFSLKSVVKSFYNNNFIQTTYDTDIVNGLDAMMYAFNKYKSIEYTNQKNTIKNTFMQIIKYNEVDCKVIWEILLFLRKKYLL